MVTKSIVILILALVFTGGITAQNEPQTKAFMSNAYGTFDEENVRAMFDIFFATVNEQEGRKGIVAIYGPLKELADRKQLMVNHVRFRRFDPSRIGYRFIGGTMEPKTELWIVPTGVEEPKFSRDRWKAAEFGSKNNEETKKDISIFYEYLSRVRDDNILYIINYGSSRFIARRERLIIESFGRMATHDQRVTMVSGGERDFPGSVFWLAPPESDPPRP